MIDDTDRLELWLHYATSTRYRQFSAVREEYYYLEEAWEDVQKGRMERLVAHFKEGRRNSLLSCRAELYRILAQLFAEEETHGELRRLLAPAALRLKAREPVSVPELAALCHMSVTHFRRQFQKAFGESPLKYRSRHLVDSAKELLEEGRSVKEIAYLLGIDDPSYFSRLFRKQAGLSPEEFRRLL